MALVVRGNKKYFYRSIREGGRVTSEYGGSGEVAEAAAKLVESDRARKTAENEDLDRRLRQVQRRLESFEEPIQEYNRLVDSLTNWTLIGLGYYLHKRTWRPRRMTSKEREQSIRKTTEFLMRIQNGDPTTLEFVKRLLDLPPEVDLPWPPADLATRVVDGILDSVAGKDLLTREAIRRKVENIRKGLAGPSPSTIVAILAERLAVNYLAAYNHDIRVQRLMGKLPPKEMDFADRQRDRADKRFQGYVKTFAFVSEKLAVAEEGSNGTMEPSRKVDSVLTATSETPKRGVRADGESVRKVAMSGTRRKARSKSGPPKRDGR